MCVAVPRAFKCTYVCSSVISPSGQMIHYRQATGSGALSAALLSWKRGLETADLFSVSSSDVGTPTCLRLVFVSPCCFSLLLLYVIILCSKKRQ